VVVVVVVAVMAVREHWQLMKRRELVLRK